LCSSCAIRDRTTQPRVAHSKSHGAAGPVVP
jgi:hypothetical protein